MNEYTSVIFRETAGFHNQVIVFLLFINSSTWHIELYASPLCYAGIAAVDEAL